MKKLILFCLVLLSMSFSGLMSQNAPIATLGVAATTAASTTLNITAVNFTDIGSFDINIAFDPAIVAVSNVVTPVGGYVSWNSTGTPGHLLIGWFTFPGMTLPNNSVILTITFTRVSCGISALTWFDPDPPGTKCIYYDGNGNSLNDSPASTYYFNGSVAFCQPVAAAGAITGAASVCQGQNNVAYTVPAIACATGYSWAYSGSGASITNNGGNITINFSPASTSGTLTVYGQNSCGNTGTISPDYSITVNPAVIPAVSISASDTTICSGTSVTFTATPSNGGTPVYQWKINGGSVGTNSSVFTSSTLANGDIITCEMTSTVACATPATVTSNPVTMTVNPLVTPAISVSASAAVICTGNSVTFTATPTNGGTPSYQWRLNNGNVGTDSVKYTNTGLINGDVVSCIMTSTAPCASPTVVSSNEIVMAVYSSLTPAVVILVSDTIICAGTSVSFIATPTNGGTPSYQWKLNGGNVGTNSSIYSNSALLQGDTVTCVMTSSFSCASPASVMSNSIKMTVNPLPAAAGTISGTPTVCQGQNGVSYSVSSITNASSYTWTYSGTGASVSGSTNPMSINFSPTATSGTLTVRGTNACGNGTVSANYSITVNPLPSAAGTITGTATVCQGQNGVSYSVGAITNATSYTWTYTGTGASISGSTNPMAINFSPLATSGNLAVRGTNNCGNGTVSANYSITVNPLPSAAGAITGTSTVCQGQNGVSYSVTSITNASSYTWTYTGTGASISGSTNPMTINFSPTATSGALTVRGTNACGNGTVSANYSITVNPLPSAAGTITGTSTVCQGQNGVSYSVTSITNATSYTWTYTGTGASVSGSTNPMTINFSPTASSGTLTVRGTNACGNGAVSANYSITVNANLPVSLNISAIPSGAICSGTSVTFTATPTNGGISPIYQWKKNGFMIGTNSDTCTNATWVNGDVIICELTSNAQCPTGNPATSNILNMLVNTSPAITVHPFNSTIGSGGSTSFDITATGTGLSYQWQVSTDGGANYNNIVAAGTDPVYSNWTTSTLGLTGAVIGNDGYMYRCYINGTCIPSVTSNGATLTVNNAPAITSQPANAAVCNGANTIFSIAATGTITGYQWQVSTDGGSNYNNITAAGTDPVYSDWTTSTLGLAGVVTVNDGYRFRCIVLAAVPPDAISNSAILNVQVAPSVSSQPSNSVICAGSNTNFIIVAAGAGLTYQWQVSTDGGTNYNNIAAAGTNPVYSNWTTAALGLTGAVIGNNGSIYRCIVNGTCIPSATSFPATLTVNPILPVSVNIAAVPAGAICPGTNVTFTATPVNGGISPIYQWKKNGFMIGTNSDTCSNAIWVNGDEILCELTSNATCAAPTVVNSNAINMLVNPVLTPSVSISSAPSDTVCPGVSQLFTAIPVNGGIPTYQWTVDGVDAGTGSTFSGIFSNGQLIGVTMTSTAACVDPDTATASPITVSVYAVTPVTINLNFNTLVSSAALGNQWYEQTGGLIGGAILQNYIPDSNGNYYTIVTDTNGCTDTSNMINVNTVSVDENNANTMFSIYPNPTKGSITLTFADAVDRGLLRIENAIGQLICEEVINQKAKSIKTIDLTRYPTGVYFMIISDQRNGFMQKVVFIKN